MVRQYHQLNGHEFEQTLGGGEGQGSLVCCSPWGHKESDMTQQLNTPTTPTIRKVKDLKAALSNGGDYLESQDGEQG